MHNYVHKTEINTGIQTVAKLHPFLLVGKLFYSKYCNCFIIYVNFESYFLKQSTVLQCVMVTHCN